MARIIVTPDPAYADDRDATRTILDERIIPVQLETEQASLQFIERIGWAINDAAEFEERGTAL